MEHKNKATVDFNKEKISFYSPSIENEGDELSDEYHDVQ